MTPAQVLGVGTFAFLVLGSLFARDWIQNDLEFALNRLVGYVACSGLTIGALLLAGLVTRSE